jgi:hypothetical protein
MSKAISLHAEYCHAVACGFSDHPLKLPSDTVKGIAMRLRGISAITAVLMADNAGDTDGGVDLGNWLRHGLIDAAYSLASDAGSILHEADERANSERERQTHSGRREGVAA